MGTIRRWTLLLPFLALLAGCLDYTERITVHRDGSATIRLKLRVANTLRTLIGQNPAFRALATLTSEERLKEALPEGVEVKSYQTVKGASRQTYIAELYAADVRGLDLGSSPAFKGQTFIVETTDDGDIHYHRKLDFTDAGRDPEMQSMISENRMGVVGILRSSTFTFEFETPLGVKSTSGEKDEGVVSWSYNLLELIQKPVEQELVMNGPTTTDYLLGALRMAFRPQNAPFTAVALLIIFFAIAYPIGRRRAASSTSP